MAFEIPVFSISLEADDDLRLLRFHFVKLDGGKAVPCDAAEDNPIGILQNTPNTGEMATVMCCGVSKIVSSAPLAIDKFVGTHTDGTGAPYIHGTATTSYIVGQVVLASSAKDGVATIAFNCLGAGRAA